MPGSPAKRKYTQPDRRMFQRGQQTKLLDDIVRLQHKLSPGLSGFYRHHLLSSVIIDGRSHRDDRYQGLGDERTLT
jgi:hypothetical protein